MKLNRRFVFTLVLVVCTGAGLLAQAPPQVTTTLLPMAAPRTENPDGFPWVQADPKKETTLQFDLSALPPGLPKTSFVRCTLRVVAKTVVFDKGKPNTGAQPVIVKGRVADVPNALSITSLSVLSEKRTVAIQTSDDSNPALRDAVYDKYSSGNKVFSVTLFTETLKASTIFYSLGEPFSSIPRLVIEYKPQPPSLLETLSWPQHQQSAEHAGRNPWMPFAAPLGFNIEKVNLPPIAGSGGTIADYPLTYRGNIYLIYQADRNYLVCLDFTGKNKLWQKEIATGTVQRSPAISRQGWLYAVAETQIAAYDLNRNGEPVASYPLQGKLSNFTDLTVGNDGSVFLALRENNLNYIYGFTPRLVPFLKSASFDKNISTITVNVEGNKVFAQTNKGATVIDLVNPSGEKIIPLEDAWEYYHVPLATPAEGIMVFTDFTANANKGNVRAYVANKIWNSPGTLVPQPVIGSNGVVYFIQGGKLQGHKYNQIGPATISSGDGLKTSSNLVMDGANDIFFWNSGALSAYKQDGSVLFPPKQMTQELADRQGDGPEKFIRLMMGPDGTLWANNKNGNSLFAFQPVYSQPDLTIAAKDIANQTAYRATGRLTVAEGGVLKDGTATLFQGGTGIGLPKGFRVEKGASLLCRAGK